MVPSGPISHQFPASEITGHSNAAAPGNLSNNQMDMAYAQRDAARYQNDHMQATIQEVQCPNAQLPHEDWRALLDEWRLSKFVDEFEENGYDDPRDWCEMTDEELKGFGMRMGHLRKWKRLMTYMKVQDNQVLQYEDQQRRGMTNKQDS